MAWRILSHNEASAQRGLDEAPACGP